MRHRSAVALRGLVVGGCLWLIAAPALAALSKNEIRELEDLLARIGFDPGSVDGVLDAQTRTAIKGYQDFAALPVSRARGQDKNMVVPRRPTKNLGCPDARQKDHA